MQTHTHAHTHTCTAWLLIFTHKHTHNLIERRRQDSTPAFSHTHKQAETETETDNQTHTTWSTASRREDSVRAARCCATWHAHRPYTHTHTHETFAKYFSWALLVEYENYFYYFKKRCSTLCVGCLCWNPTDSRSRYCVLYIGWRKCIGCLIRCRSLFAKEPLIIGLFCGKWPVKIRHPMGLCHPVGPFW